MFDSRNKFKSKNKILILCDCGGNNQIGKLWKGQLYILSSKIELEIYVSHYPTGCSKYNPIEHRLFSAITQNWAGIPLRDINTVVNLINNTRTTTGLSVKCFIDKSIYKVKNNIFTDKEFKNLDITITEESLGKFNYRVNGVKI